LAIFISFTPKICILCFSFLFISFYLFFNMVYLPIALFDSCKFATNSTSLPVIQILAYRVITSVYIGGGGGEWGHAVNISLL
jgi:hypothetical protein